MSRAKENADYPVYLFHEGTNFSAYEFFGPHTKKNEKTFTTSFRVWAPNAKTVNIIGEIKDGDGISMTEIKASGIWEANVVSEKPLCNKKYKYRICDKGGLIHVKADPFAFFGEAMGKKYSVVPDEKKFRWTDSGWMALRKKRMNRISENGRAYSVPMNIYEVHLGSWRTRDSASTKDGEHYLNYRQIADELSQYAVKMGYTHVELLPIMEHPFDGSWGYQVCSYYAPTSRFGTPDDFRYFVNKLHKCGIGVILDWVPAHFPKDDHGLYEFDGSLLYEYADWHRMEHKGWGTRFFDLGKNEVRSFLISNALFWLREYHADGLRVDAVASMLYLDFDRAPGEWLPNKYGDRINLEAEEFFKRLNTAIASEFPDALMIAEESASYGMITKRVEDGGLGFDFKWNMGWSNDLFEYVGKTNNERKAFYNKLTFPMMYAYNENYILPVSHDEVVHGKLSLINKMNVPYEDKFPMMRTFLVYMMTLPGKKLSFMGNEYAQFREWDYENELEWFMKKYPLHDSMSEFTRTLNSLYLKHSELWEIEDGWDGFEWIECNDENKSVIAYRRRNLNGDELIAVINFSAESYLSYPLRTGKRGSIEELLSTDEYRFSGNGNYNGKRKATVHELNGKRVWAVDMCLPAMTAWIFKKPKSRKKTK